MIGLRHAFLLVTLGFLTASAAAAAPAPRSRPYRLPAVDLKQRVIWGSVAEAPDGTALSFGGQDQLADDAAGEEPRPPTRLRIDGRWIDLRGQLREANPLQPLHAPALAAAAEARACAAQRRAQFFRGRPDAGLTPQAWAELRTEVRVRALAAEVTQLGERLEQHLRPRVLELRPADVARYESVRALWQKALGLLRADPASAAIELERAAELLDAEPPARALSPLVYEPKTKLFLLFGGDHGDCLTNDTWAFDPAARRWARRSPSSAPRPRANHRLRAPGDGTVVLEGGYAYANNTDYMGGQYVDHGDGPFTYDVAADAWAGPEGAKLDEPDRRVYRAGPFHPSFFLRDPAPDAAAFALFLDALPANTWTAAAPPYLPQMNRDWGTAILDTERDLILRFAGGHSAHGGSDVLHYHLSSNRWELPFPVEFPLGQTYVNTEYPEGWNFNRRPWVTGHTYQAYGYDPVLRKLVFVGRKRFCYVYDVDRADWSERFPKPKAMDYGDAYYTLTLCPTPRGLVCWTKDGAVLRLEAQEGKAPEWKALPLAGEKLPGSVVDTSTLTYDSKRDRLLFFRAPYNKKGGYDGQVYALDLAKLHVTGLSPKGMAGVAHIPYLCQIRYDPEHDLCLVGATMPPVGEGGPRRTPAYDPAGNRWVTLALAGADPNGKSGRNVSLGLVYDARRGLFWAVDAASRVYVLRLDVEAADLRPVE